MTVKGNLQFYLIPIQHPLDPEVRSKAIKHRRQKLESSRQNLKKTQKWPNQKTMSAHLYKQLTQVPEIIIQPPTPRLLSGWSAPESPARPSTRTLSQLLGPPVTPRAEFPYPVTSSSSPIKEKSFIESSFIYFQFLPVELRLQIWGEELRRPKMVEAQFASQFCGPTFVGGCTRGSSLLYVCRESREVAMMAEWSFLTPMQRDFGKKWSRTPFIPAPVVEEKALPFLPETDTIFFRSLDKPAGGLQSIACSLAGYENIQHLALPLPLSGLPLKNEWKMCLSYFHDLKTLTFMVGGWDQSWISEEEVELRDVEEWFADGRDRTVRIERWCLDVGEVGAYLGGRVWQERMRGSWDDGWQGINVRCVAWKKGD